MAHPFAAAPAPNANRLVAGSITYWMRGEPDPRDDDLIEPLRARIRDPLWMLARQWQLGEFGGADSGSPAYVELSERTGRVTSWSIDGGAPRALGGGPLEYDATREPFPPDLATRLEMGQTFETLLDEHGASGVVGDFRTAYSVSAVPLDAADVAELRLRRVCAGRAIDGLALLDALRVAAPGLPANPAVATALVPNVTQAASDYLTWVDAVIGATGTTDPDAWRADRLEYRLDVNVTTPDTGQARLLAQPGGDALLDWSAFDLESAAPARQPGKALTRTTIPAHVRFRGAPNARFWDFETAGTDLAGIVPDKRDLARLAISEFVLVHANDWFVLPIDLAPGTLYQLDSALVHDVFGTLTRVDRADRDQLSQGRWTMFTTSVAGGSADQTADFFFLPPTAGAALERGGAIEEVLFARDEMANMVWALERLTENQAGEGWSGHERDVARNGAVNAPLPPVAQDAPVPLQYLIESRVPEWWIPFLPVSIDPARGIVALERSAMLRGDGTPVEPLGRILRPSSVPVGTAYQVPEEEVPRTGVRVQRLVCRSRWSDGSTYLWTMREVAAGRGEANSALRFDSAAPNSGVT
jgi:hypothetical protein